jgi:hypothetical protein
MELTKEEKIDIVNQHLKNVVINIYNLNILLIQESALDIPNQEAIDSIQLQIDSAFKKKISLESKLEELKEE